MVSVVVFEFSGMRCQPLRRALGILLAAKLTSDNSKLLCLLLLIMYNLRFFEIVHDSC